MSSQTVVHDSTITFSSVGYEPVTIHSGEKKWIEITLKESQSLLPEITVTSTLKNSMKFVFAPSDLELIKDMLYLKTRYKIPSKRFHYFSIFIVRQKFCKMIRPFEVALLQIGYSLVDKYG